MKVWLPAIRGHSGTDVYTRRLCAALVRRGVEAEIRWFPTHCQYLPQLLSLAQAPAGTDIIHANGWHGMAFRRRQPLVLTEHQGAFGRDQRPYRGRAQELYHTQIMRRYLRRSLQLADAVVAVSAEVASGLARNFGFSGSQVIHNFIDTTRFCPGDTLAARSRFQLLFVGNFAPLKGSELLRALLARLGDRFELCFTSGLKDLHTGALPDNMRCLGRIDDENTLVNAYRQCDAVIVPSYFEGFGYTALEGMACGKPVIASRAGALPEVVADGTTGILCNPGDLAAFEAACRRLADDPATTRRMGAAGRARAAEHFSEPVAVARYLDLYAACLDSRDRGIQNIQG